MGVTSTAVLVSARLQSGCCEAPAYPGFIITLRLLLAHHYCYKSSATTGYESTLTSVGVEAVGVAAGVVAGVGAAAAGVANV